VVGDVAVAVLCCEFAGVEFEIGGSEPDRLAAATAKQIVAVSRARAESIKGLTAFSTLRLGDVLFGHGLQDPVHSGQSDANGRLRAQFQVELLSATEMVTVTHLGSAVDGHMMPPDSQDDLRECV
jgi:hypothetical protein